MKKRTWLSIGVFSLAAGLSPACSSDDTEGDAGDGDGTGTGGTVVIGSGGNGAGTGGNGAGTGGNGAGTGGNGTGTGGNGTGTGGNGLGGEGIGGEGIGGEGGEGGVAVECDGCAVLYVPLADPLTGTDVELDYGEGTEADFTATIVTVRLKIVTAGNAGGLQLYAKNGAGQNYASLYQGWTNLASDGEFTDVVLDLAAHDDSTGDFDKSVIRYIGINVTAGDAWDGANWQPTSIYVDSITFSDGAEEDLTFTSGLDALAINAFNSPLAGSTLTHQP